MHAQWLVVDIHGQCGASMIGSYVLTVLWRFTLHGLQRDGFLMKGIFGFNFVLLMMYVNYLAEENGQDGLVKHLFG